MELEDRLEASDDLVGLAPPDAADPLIEAFKKDADRTLLMENLCVSPLERSRRFLRGMKSVYELRRAGERHRAAWRPKDLEAIAELQALPPEEFGDGELWSAGRLAHRRAPGEFR